MSDFTDPSQEHIPASEHDFIVRQVFKAAVWGNCVQFEELTHDCKCLKEILDYRDDCDENVLHVAARYDRFPIGEKILALLPSEERKNYVNRRTYDFITALHLAALSGTEALVELLLSNGADISARTETGYTPLHFAAAACSDTVVRMLVLQGARRDVVTEIDCTPLDYGMHNMQCSRLLLDRNDLGG